MCYLIAISPLTATFLEFVKLHFSSKIYILTETYMSNAETLIHAFMTSSLDYFNAFLGECSACLINKLQMVQNSAARFLTRTRKYDHIMTTIHWLSIKHCIDFKILLLLINP